MGWGHFQIEIDFANLTYDLPNQVQGNIRSKNYQIAPMNIKVGLLNNVDFQLVIMPFQWDRVEDGEFRYGRRKKVRLRRHHSAHQNKPYRQ